MWVGSGRGGIFRVLYSPGRALGFGLTLAGMVAVSMLLRAGLPAGRTRRHVLAGLPGLWVAVVGGGWLARLYLGGLGGWLVAGLGLVVVAGIPQLGVWWATHGRRHTVRLAAAGGALLVLVPVAAGYWVWNMSAHLGTAGEPDPKAAVATWFRAMYPGMGTPDKDVERLVCSAPAAGRADMLDFQRQWTAYERRLGLLPDRGVVRHPQLRARRHRDGERDGLHAPAGHRVDHEPPAA